MNSEEFSTMIANDSEREKVFAEIYYQEEQWAEISQEGSVPMITLFPPSNGGDWELPLKEALEAIEKAKTLL